jgi:S1-C subfamily serine protease
MRSCEDEHRSVRARRRLARSLLAGLAVTAIAAVGVTASAVHPVSPPAPRYALTGFAAPHPDPCVKCARPGRSVNPGAPTAPPDANSSGIAAAADPAIVDVTVSLPDGSAAGTGMILTPSGEILTNKHVIANATSVMVKISNGSQRFPATVVGADPVNDVAVLQAQGASGLPTIPIGDSSRLTIGQPVVAIGNALNRPGPPTVTTGAVSGLDRSITVDTEGGPPEQLSDLIEITALIQPGNSGGPLLDTTGRVIGMNTAASVGQIPQSGTNDGFAIPMNDAVTIVHQIENSHVPVGPSTGPPGFLGVVIQNTNRSGDSSHSVPGPRGATLPGPGGALVAGVQPGSPAATAGIVPGDQLATIDGQSILSSATLAQIIGARHAGDIVQITWVDQAGGQHHAAVTLAAAPTSP